MGGKTHGESSTRLYHMWGNMKDRCNNPHNNRYHLYGGRGIKVCPEWEHDFAAFRDWAISRGYRDDLTIDRIDNDMGYSPDNCRWATVSDQNRNRRHYNRRLQYTVSCTLCGRTVATSVRGQKYCKDCARRIKNKQSVESARRRKLKKGG